MGSTSVTSLVAARASAEKSPSNIATTPGTHGLAEVGCRVGLLQRPREERRRRKISWLPSHCVKRPRAAFHAWQFPAQPIVRRGSGISTPELFCFCVGLIAEEGHGAAGVSNLES